MSRYGRHETPDETVTENMGLVGEVIRKHFRWHRRYSAEVEDVEQMGAIGLLSAHRTYQEGKGAFSTHAFWRIRGSITVGMRNYGHATMNVSGINGRWNHAVFSALGDEAQAPYEIAEPKPTPALDVRDQVRFLSLAFRGKDPRLFKILLLRHARGKTLQEVAVRFGLTRERIRQLEAKAFEIARARLRREDVA